MSKIICVYIIISKKFPNQFYIGSTKDFKNRKSVHIYELKNNKNGCYNLQSHVSTYGIDDLTFDILEHVEIEKLCQREQYFIDMLLPSFNICKIAGSLKGRKPRESTRAKLSIARKGRVPSFGHKHSDETKKKISAIVKGRICKPETREKMRKAWEKRKLLNKKLMVA